MHGYQAQRPTSVNCQKIDDGPVLPVLVPFDDASRLPGVTCYKIFDVERVYRRYRSVVNVCGDVPDDFTVDVVDDFDDIFEQEALPETGGGSSFLPNDLSVSSTALQRLSKIVPT